MMRDQVDLEQTAQRVRQERQGSRQELWGILAPLGLSVLMFLGMLALFQVRRSFTVNLLHFTGERWQPLARLSHYPGDVQVSPGGVTWVETDESGLGRFDGTGWQYFQGQGHSDLFRMHGGLKLVGEALWGITPRAVLHFDGQGWITFTLASATPRDIVADESGVWVIDGAGNLSHFDGEEWTVGSLREALPGVPWDDADFRDPTLARTPDGALWLAVKGLWRFDEGAWQEARPQGKYLEGARLVGVTGDRLWIQHGRDLLWMRLDGAAEGGRYALAGMGLPEDARVDEVAATQDGRVWAVTGKEVLTFDGTSWERLSLPADQGRIVGAGLNADGTAWVAGYEERGERWRGLIQILGLVMTAGTIFGLFFAMGRSLKTLGQREARERKAARQVVADLPEEKPSPVAAETFSEVGFALAASGLLVLFFILFFFVLIYFVPAAWFNAPPWLTGVLVGCVVMIVVLGIRGIVAAFRAPRGQALAALGQDLRKGVKLVVYFVLAVSVGMLVINVVWTSGTGGWLSRVGDAVFTLLTIMGAVVFGALVISMSVLPTYWALAPLRRTDYAGALRRVRFLGRWYPQSATFLYLRGTVHRFAGEYGEAEARLRESLAQRGDFSALSAALENLGRTLIGQGRYEEAAKTLAGAIEIRPEGCGPYIALAEVYLRQGLQPERALELLARAQENKAKSFLRRRADRYQWGQIWASRAWALALQGLYAEADAALEGAFQVRDPKFAPGLADLHCRAGQVMRLRGDEAGAVEHWRQAQQVDPQGEGGQWATQLLHL
jgi:Tfp pilus assembly protein PilF